MDLPVQDGFYMIVNHDSKMPLALFTIKDKVLTYEPDYNNQKLFKEGLLDPQDEHEISMMIHGQRTRATVILMPYKPSIKEIERNADYSEEADALGYKRGFKAFNPKTYRHQIVDRITPDGYVVFTKHNDTIGDEDKYSTHLDLIKNYDKIQENLKLHKNEQISELFTDMAKSQFKDPENVNLTELEDHELLKYALDDDIQIAAKAAYIMSKRQGI